MNLKLQCFVDSAWFLSCSFYGTAPPCMSLPLETTSLVSLQKTPQQTAEVSLYNCKCWCVCALTTWRINLALPIRSEAIRALSLFRHRYSVPACLFQCLELLHSPSLSGRPVCWGEGGLRLDANRPIGTACCVANFYTLQS